MISFSRPLIPTFVAPIKIVLGAMETPREPPTDCTAAISAPLLAAGVGGEALGRAVAQARERAVHDAMQGPRDAQGVGCAP